MRTLSHAIFGGYDLRHEGCAPKCCEAEACAVSPETHSICATHCGGCDGRLDRAPLPMDFDRDAPCEAHS